MNTTPRNPQAAPKAAGGNLRRAEVVLTVTKFRDVLQGPFKEGTCSEHQIAVPAKTQSVFLHTGYYQENKKEMRTIRVDLPGAVLRFTVAKNMQDKEDYRPIGITFARADKTQPSAVYCIAGTQTAPNSPFRLTGVNRSWLEVEDTIVPGQQGLDNKGETVTPTHITYKFSVIIQRHSDGAIGIIDPYVENEN
jgi:hypothetical protein